MCQVCEEKASPNLSRRKLITTLAASAGLLAAGIPAFAASPPKPENVISPDEALKRLIAGNQRYVSNQPLPADFAATRAALAGGQNPYASLLSCADSRISPELCFDAERGDLFVTRVAGNFVTPEILASLEYGAAVLKSPLIMVLGHTSCGAINAAIKAVKNDEDFPGHIQQLTSNLAPAVDAAMKKDPNNLENAAVRENVRLNVTKLQNSTPILRRLVQNHSLRVVGGVYDLKTGQVALV
jgi:carbonic anhydrase